MKYVYLLAGDPNELALAQAEAEALAGGQPIEPRIFAADTLVDIARTGYINAGMELIASGRTVAEVCERVRPLGIAADRFGIEVMRVPRGLDVSRHETGDAFGKVIEGKPDLTNPLVKFIVFATATGVWFGRTIDFARHDWERFVKKPHDFSSALPVRNARAICNLVIRGGERIIDPCCGTGTILIQAATLGARITGYDINPKMVASANANLEHFGLPRVASQGDAAELAGEYDLLITNIPYGNMSEITPEKAERLLANILRLAPRGVIVAGDDLTAQIQSHGVQVTRRIELRKLKLIRQVFEFSC